MRARRNESAGQKEIAMIARAITTVLCCCLCSAALAEDCKPSNPDASLPMSGGTRPPGNGLPAPPTENDCAFYNWAWQSFLFVTQKRPDGKPAFLGYSTIEQAFPKIFKPGVKSSTTLSVRNIEPSLNSEAQAHRGPLTEKSGDPLPVLTDGIMQASQSGPGFGAILVDQRRNPVFYTIHVNDAFAQFVQANGLDEIERLLADPASTDENEQAKRPVPAELEFRPGVMEFKSAWMIVEGPVSAYSNYIVTRAKIPYLKNNDSSVVVDDSRPPREVNVALLALHVVGVIDGHPEFIWATFEHADANGRRDIAPASSANPTVGNPPPPIDGASKSYPLFGANTAPNKANDATPQQIGGDQKFPVATSIYRVFPGSKSAKDTQPDNRAPWEDPAVFTLNEHMTALFKARDPYKRDLRRNYRLVGAVWMNQPRKDGFDAGLSFVDDDPKLAGENRLSNMAIESFTQDPSQGGAPHCFSCHDTAIQSGLPGGRKLPARRINVSHIFAIAAAKALAPK
jgi:hypothetical protein